VGMAPYFVISLCEIFYELPEPHYARGNVCAETLALQVGTICLGNRSKA
jgi:hypothetical protein